MKTRGVMQVPLPIKTKGDDTVSVENTQDTFLFVENADALEVMQLVLVELRKMNLHLSSITELDIQPEDLNEELLE